MTTADANDSDADKAAEEAKPEPATAEKKGKPLIGRTAAVGIGIGSAALVAALLYASRHKPGQR